MSTLPGGPTAESTFVPHDPYEDRWIQALALQSLGFPAVIEPTTSEVVAVAKPDKLLQLKLARHPRWLQISYPPELNRFVEDPAAPGGAFALEKLGCTNRQIDLVNNHPVLLTSQVANGEVNDIFWALQNFKKKGDYDRLQHSDPAYPWQELLASCAIAAAIRANQEEPFSLPNLQHDLKTLLHDNHDELDRTPKDYRPINPEVLVGLSIDYYRMMAGLVPEFAELREAGPPDAPSRTTPPVV